MTQVKISQLPIISSNDEDISIPVSSNNGTRKIDFSFLAEKLWDQMYIHAKAVIVQCPFCNCHNAVTNAACISCGGPMGGTL